MTERLTTIALAALALAVSAASAQESGGVPASAPAPGQSLQGGPGGSSPVPDGAGQTAAGIEASRRCSELSGVAESRVVLPPGVGGFRFRNGGGAQEVAPILAACRASAEAAPQDGRRQWMLGLALYEARRIAEARAAYAGAAALGAPGGFAEGAALERSEKDRPRAIAIAREGVEKTNDPETRRLLAGLLSSSGPDQDLPGAARLLDAAPDFPAARADLAMLRLKGGLGGDREAPDPAGARAMLDEAVATGDALAALRRAQFLERTGASREETAAAWALALERDDTPLALTLAADFLEEGATPANWPRGDAETLLRQAALAGGMQAQVRLARLLDNRTSKGEPLPAEQRQALERESLKWSELAFARGDACSGLRAGMFYDHGRSVPLDYKRSFDLFSRSAEQGCPAAVSNLGYAWQHGRGVERDPKKAVEYFEKAVAMGSSAAMSNLSSILKAGEIVPRDEKRAFELLQKAASGSVVSANSLNNLAFAYEEGEGVEADPAKARELYRQAVDLGSAQAMHNLAAMCEKGQGGPRDNACAHTMFRRAALRAAHSNSFYRYAGRLERDGCEDRDRMPGGGLIAPGEEGCKAAQRGWLVRAVEAGDGNGRQDLVEMLLDGEGGPADPQKALEILKAAATDPAGRLAYAQALGGGRVDDHGDRPEARRIYASLLDDEDEGDEAAIGLARMMTRGHGGPRDLKGARDVLKTRWEEFEGLLVGSAYVRSLRESAPGVPADRARARQALVAMVEADDASESVITTLIAPGLDPTVTNEDRALARRLLEQRAGRGDLNPMSWGTLAQWRGSGFGGARDAAGRLAAAREASRGATTPYRMPMAMALAARPEREARGAALSYLALAILDLHEGFYAQRLLDREAPSQLFDAPAPQSLLDAFAAPLAQAYGLPAQRRWDKSLLERARLAVAAGWGSKDASDEDRAAARRLREWAQARAPAAEALVERLLSKPAPAGKRKAKR